MLRKPGASSRRRLVIEKVPALMAPKLLRQGTALLGAQMEEERASLERRAVRKVDGLEHALSREACDWLSVHVHAVDAQSLAVRRRNAVAVREQNDIRAPG